jgi:hypothetical protein
MIESPVKALIFHANDWPIVGMIESINEDVGHEKFRARITRWIPFRLESGNNGGRSAILSVFKGSTTPVWQGRIIEVAPGVKKREVLGLHEFGFTRDETLYLALASLHSAWLEIAYGEHMTKRLTDVFFPPMSVDLRLNDFPFIFLVNDKSHTFVRGDYHILLYYTQISIALFAALARSWVWQQPRSVVAQVNV